MIVSDYALEKKDDNGKPTGTFIMTNKLTKMASEEMLKKHKHLDGKELDNYMNQYYGRTWEHFDVNKEDKLDIMDMPAFMKYLASDQSIDLD